MSVTELYLSFETDRLTTHFIYHTQPLKHLHSLPDQDTHLTLRARHHHYPNPTFHFNLIILVWPPKLNRERPRQVASSLSHQHQLYPLYNHQKVLLLVALRSLTTREAETQQQQLHHSLSSPETRAPLPPSRPIHTRPSQCQRWNLCHPPSSPSPSMVVSRMQIRPTMKTTITPARK